MTEILTESFCERCGTRYTFEPVTHRSKPMSAIGTLGRGIRHFVSDPGSSLDEAFAVARSESEQRTTATALEAFHRTFNFCLSCRRYTCADCWNAVEGRCLSCSPVPEAAEPTTRADTPVRLLPLGASSASAAIYMELPGGNGADAAEAEAQAAADAQAAEAQAAEDAALVAETDARVAAQAAEADAAAAMAQVAAEEAAQAQSENEARAAAEAATDALAAAEAEAEAAALAATEAEAAAAAAALAEAEAEAGATAAALAEAEAMQATADAEARAAAEAAKPTLEFEPGLNLDEQIAAYERAIAAAAPGAVPTEPVAVEPEPVVEPEPEPVAAELEVAEPEPVEPVVLEAAPEPAVEPAAASPEPIPTAIGKPIPASVTDGSLHWPEPAAAAAVYEAHWPNVPKSTRGPSRSGAGRAPAEPAAAVYEAQWPNLPTVVAKAPTHAGANLPGAETAPPPAPARACPSCGLSLSASARFCRRCGTPQQVDAAR